MGCSLEKLWKKNPVSFKLFPVPSTPCSSDTVYECPDYQTAGENSCFFNKNNTSIWVNYNITVVATNELGSTFSDSVDIDVVYIGERPAMLFLGCFFFLLLLLGFLCIMYSKCTMSGIDLLQHVTKCKRNWLSSFLNLLCRNNPVTNKTGTDCLVIKGIVWPCVKAPSPMLPRYTNKLQWTHSFLFLSPRSLSPVKPNPPEKLTVVIMEDNSYPFLRVSWEPPHKADTRSGWITLIYEIRVKLEGRNDWEVRTCFRLSALNLLFIKILKYPSDADRSETL